MIHMRFGISHYQTRGCTGFDGDFEFMEAIRRPGLRTNLDLNINADNRFALAA